MNTHICSRCDSEFYTVMPASAGLKCPYCGFESKGVKGGAERRIEQRARILRECSILRETGSITARAVDITCKGIGLQFQNHANLSRGEVLRLKVSDFDLDSKAVVVWSFRGSQGRESAGLMFV